MTYKESVFLLLERGLITTAEYDVAYEEAAFRDTVIECTSRTRCSLESYGWTSREPAEPHRSNPPVPLVGGSTMDVRWKYQYRCLVRDYGTVVAISVKNALLGGRYPIFGALPTRADGRPIPPTVTIGVGNRVIVTSTGRHRFKTGYVYSITTHRARIKLLNGTLTGNLKLNGLTRLDREQRSHAEIVAQTSVAIVPPPPVEPTPSYDFERQVTTSDTLLGMTGDDAEILLGLCEDDCPICLCEIETDSVTTHCGHRFHRGCIMENLKHSNKCPLCRHIFQPKRRPIIVNWTHDW
jgi:hypothetical protein